MPLSEDLKFHYAFLYGHGNFQPNTLGFENLKSVGVDIIKNKVLRKELAELYSYKYYSFVEDRRNVVKEYQMQQAEAINQNIKINLARESAEPINIEDLEKNTQFQNTLITNIALLKWVNDKYEKGKIDISQLQQKIKIELED